MVQGTVKWPTAPLKQTVFHKIHIYTAPISGFPAWANPGLTRKICGALQGV
jgi:hypothetical protein